LGLLKLGWLDEELAWAEPQLGQKLAPLCEAPQFEQKTAIVLPF
jgi:hypothetical protein